MKTFEIELRHKADLFLKKTKYTEQPLPLYLFNKHNYPFDIHS